MIIARVVALVLTAILAGCAGGPARSPSAVVERLYSERIDADISGAPTPGQLESIAPYLTPELQGLLEEARRLRDAEAAASPDEKPAFADGDLFSSLFEGPTAFRVVEETTRGDAHRVVVHFTHADGADTTSWTDTVVVVPDATQYLVADIEYAGHWDFANRGSLVANLRGALAEPHAPCPEVVPGTWVVSGHSAPGISAMSEAEAGAWNGSALELRRERMTFREQVCPSPAFETRHLQRRDFAEQFRISADALKLPPGGVCVTEVACVDEAPMPGSLLVHGRDELLMLWDGVWFRAHRH